MRHHRKSRNRLNHPFVNGLFGEQGQLHAAPALQGGDGMTTDKALADERETIGLMQNGHDRGRVVMRSWMAQARLHKGPLTQGQKQAVKLILSARDRVVGVQGYAGTGKTTMLNRARALAGKSGYRAEPLNGIAVVIETAADEVGEERARVAARGQDSLHRAVLLRQVNEDGGAAPSGTPPAAPSRPDSFSTWSVARCWRQQMAVVMTVIRMGTSEP